MPCPTQTSSSQPSEARGRQEHQIQRKISAFTGIFLGWTVKDLSIPVSPFLPMKVAPISSMTHTTGTGEVSLHCFLSSTDFPGSSSGGYLSFSSVAFPSYSFSVLFFILSGSTSSSAPPSHCQTPGVSQGLQIHV